MPSEEEVIRTLTGSFKSYFDRCHQLPPNIRFTMFVDKLLFVIGFMKAYAKENFNENDYQVAERVIQLFEEEIFALQDHLQKNDKSVMERIEMKLDEVLMGPDYGPGRQMMETAMRNFEEILEEHQS